MALGVCLFDTLPDNLVVICFQNVLDMPYYEAFKRKYGSFPHNCGHQFPQLEVDKKPLGILAQVCKRFRTLVDDEVLWEEVRLIVREETDLSIFSGGMQTRRTEWIRKLEILVEEIWEPEAQVPELIESAEWFDERVVDLVNHNCPNLEDLTIQFAAPFLFLEKGKGLCKLSLHLPKLTKLRVDGAQKLESIYLACPQLEALSITGICKLQSLDLQRNSALQLNSVGFSNEFIQKEVLQSFFGKAGKSVNSLRLGVSDGSWDSEKDVMKEMLGESFVKLSDLAPITSQILNLVSEHMPKLECLSLHGNELVPLAFRLNDLAPLAKGCPNLKRLALHDNLPSESNSNVVSCAPGNYNFDHTYWNATGGAKFSSLKQFRMEGASSHSFALQTLPAMCPNLERVEVVYARHDWYNFGKPEVSENPLALVLKDHCMLLDKFYATRLRFLATASCIQEPSDPDLRDEQIWQREIDRRYKGTYYEGYFH